MNGDAKVRWALNAWVVLTLLFLLGPIVVVILLSFSSGLYLQFPPPGFSLQWYERFFDDPNWTVSLWLSVEVSTICTLISVVLGVAASIALVRAHFPAKTVAYVLILSPLIVPAIIIALAVFFLFSRLGMVGSPVAIALGQAVMTLPLVVVIVSATLQGFDRRLEQAAVNLGASPARAFVHVTLPIISPGVIAGALLAFLVSFDELMVALLLASPTTTTLPMRIWMDVTLRIDPTVTAVSTMLIGFAFIMLVMAGVLRRGR